MIALRECLSLYSKGTGSGKHFRNSLVDIPPASHFQLKNNSPSLSYPQPRMPGLTELPQGGEQTCWLPRKYPHWGTGYCGTERNQPLGRVAFLLSASRKPVTSTELPGVAGQGDDVPSTVTHLPRARPSPPHVVGWMTSSRSHPRCHWRTHSRTKWDTGHFHFRQFFRKGNKEQQPGARRDILLHSARTPSSSASAQPLGLPSSGRRLTQGHMCSAAGGEARAPAASTAWQPMCQKLVVSLGASVFCLQIRVTRLSK